MKAPLAPPSIYLGGEYISPELIGREQFMKIMSHGLSLNEKEECLLESAYMDAKKWFEGKTRRTGSRYFEHPKAVALMGLLEFHDTSLDTTLARLYHDTPEDTHKGTRFLRANCNERVASIVGLVTNPKKTGDAEKDARAKKAHYLAIRQFPEVGKIKVPDRTHNLRSHEVRLVMDGFLPVESIIPEIIANARRQVSETIEYIIPIAETLGGKWYELLAKETMTLERAIGAIQ